MNATSKSIQRLIETVSWLSLHDVTDGLGLAPSDGCVEEVESILKRVQNLRADELSRRNVSPGSALAGKLLLLLVEMNLMDGAASGVSGYFYDEFNLPPVVTWVELVSVGANEEMALLCWVPEDCVAKAQAGIDVNPEECIDWAWKLDPELHRDLARGVEGFVRLLGV